MSDTTLAVEIPTALRPQVGDQESVEVSGGTVGELLGKLKAEYPDFGAKLYKTDTELNRFINIYLNDEDIRFLENLETPVKAGDHLAIVPAIAGG
ncbi:MoaD family protein [Algisphaera agarilytica]|uniref:MoaD family protein n=1 Tax=Algisphaera agarilytica TaxID=1385975 RepID=A0A7X0HA27_9BACT|nr:MoaD family protein [Algisphaera agarilytica]MBB6430941.1 MoaD family protein [Algisphaera agarilytica]